MKTVAVIGAGASGITALKCAVDEGLTPTCFERTDDIGGLWNYTEEVRPGQACVMKSTVINTSKEMIAYSDFPMPDEYPMYLPNKMVKRYFELYVENFDLKKYIRFNTEIQNVKPREDFKKSGQWDVTFKDKTTNTTETRVFDAVLICTGHHAEPNMPQFPGQKDFQGKIIHSHDYKHSEEYRDKRAIVVGIGNSGCDTAVDISRVSKKLFHVTRRGSWVFSKHAPNGVPFDMALVRRSINFLNGKILPTKYACSKMEAELNARFDHAAFGLKPAHSPISQHPTANDDLPSRITCGAITVKPNIKRFTKTGVEFEDGTFEDDISNVVFATGYIFGFPFLDKSVTEVKNNQVNLYQYMFPPDLEKKTLAIIGCFQPIGSIMPVSEMQCRLATRVFKGDVILPSREEMWEDMNMKRDAMKQRYVQTSRHTIQVDFIPFMDELATLNGTKPNILKMLLTDPRLAFLCFFGPCYPYQYRLEGPGKWSGARDALLGAWDRTFKSLKTRPLGLKEDGSGMLTYLFLGFMVIVLAFLIKMFLF